MISLQTPCPECLGRRECWVCDSTGEHSGAACGTCQGTGTCRRCAPDATTLPSQPGSLRPHAVAGRG